MSVVKVVRGPFELKWGDNILSQIESIDIAHDVSSDDYETIQGKTFTIDGSYKITATITLLATDIQALALVFPQYHVLNGGVMSTGETVNNADGAIDVKAASCDDDVVLDNLDIIACANPAQVLRIVKARTRINGIEIDNKIQKVMVDFIGESEADEATVQFFKQGTINVVS